MRFGGVPNHDHSGGIWDYVDVGCGIWDMEVGWGKEKDIGFGFSLNPFGIFMNSGFYCLFYA